MNKKVFKLVLNREKKRVDAHQHLDSWRTPTYDARQNAAVVAHLAHSLVHGSFGSFRKQWPRLMGLNAYAKKMVIVLSLNVFFLFLFH